MWVSDRRGGGTGGVGEPTPTTDVIAIEATSAAVEPTLKAALVVLPDLQGVRDVGAMMVEGAWLWEDGKWTSVVVK